jgi:ketosteroid isomerase-like protein
MSRTDVEVVRRMFTAFDEQKWQVALDLLDRDIEWSPTEGRYRGHQGVLSAMAEWLEPWEDHTVEAEEILEADDRVLAVVRLTGRGTGSGLEIDQRFFQLYDVDEGRIVRMVEYVTRADALAAAGDAT